MIAYSKDPHIHTILFHRRDAKGRNSRPLSRLVAVLLQEDSNVLRCMRPARRCCVGKLCIRADEGNHREKSQPIATPMRCLTFFKMDAFEAERTSSQALEEASIFGIALEFKLVEPYFAGYELLITSARNG